jgi:hypothetical protein
VEQGTAPRVLVNADALLVLAQSDVGLPAPGPYEPPTKREYNRLLTSRRLDAANGPQFFRPTYRVFVVARLCLRRRTRWRPVGSWAVRTNAPLVMARAISSTAVLHTCAAPTVRGLREAMAAQPTLISLGSSAEVVLDPISACQTDPALPCAGSKSLPPGHTPQTMASALLMQ